MGISTLETLLGLIPQLDPFKSIRLPDRANIRTPASRPSLLTLLAGDGLRDKLRQMSRAQIEVLYKGMGYRNAARDLDRIAPFTSTEVVQIPNLAAQFSASVTRQLFGTVDHGIAA
jgi:hypothetical protein